MKKLLLLAALCFSLAGCASVRYAAFAPSQEEFFFVPAGTVIGNTVAAYDGYFVARHKLEDECGIGTERSLWLDTPRHEHREDEDHGHR